MEQKKCAETREFHAFRTALGSYVNWSEYQNVKVLNYRLPSQSLADFISFLCEHKHTEKGKLDEKNHFNSRNKIEKCIDLTKLNIAET